VRTFASSAQDQTPQKPYKLCYPTLPSIANNMNEKSSMIRLTPDSSRRPFYVKDQCRNLHRRTRCASLEDIGGNPLDIGRYFQQVEYICKCLNPIFRTYFGTLLEDREVARLFKLVSPCCVADAVTGDSRVEPEVFTQPRSMSA
jgi:hypothetical protein